MVVGTVLGLDLIGADVLPDQEGGFGHTHFQPPPWFRERGPLDPRHRDYIRSVAVTFLAGTAAEALHAGFDNAWAAGFDIDTVVTEWLSRDGTDDLESRMRRLAGLARSLVGTADNWTAIERVAAALLESGSLTAAEAGALIAG